MEIRPSNPLNYLRGVSDIGKNVLSMFEPTHRYVRRIELEDQIRRAELNKTIDDIGQRLTGPSVTASGVETDKEIEVRVSPNYL